MTNEKPPEGLTLVDPATGAIYGGDAPEPPPARGLSVFDAPTAEFKGALARRGENRKALIDWIRAALVDGVDYGSVDTKRGKSKPSLRKPGAEKICGMLGVTPTFPALAEYEESARTGAEIALIVLRCVILAADGSVVAEGGGARSVAQDYGDVNKALKMALKSAHIDATLRMAGLSEIFTQDLEDMPNGAQGRRQSPDQGKARTQQPPESGGAPAAPNAADPRLKAVKEVTALAVAYAKRHGVTPDEAVAEISGYEAKGVDGKTRRFEVPSVAALGNTQRVSLKWLYAMKRRGESLLKEAPHNDSASDAELDAAGFPREPGQEG